MPTDRSKSTAIKAVNLKWFCFCMTTNVQIHIGLGDFGDTIPWLISKIRFCQALQYQGKHTK